LSLGISAVLCHWDLSHHPLASSRFWSQTWIHDLQACASFGLKGRSLWTLIRLAPFTALTEILISIAIGCCFCFLYNIPPSSFRICYKFILTFELFVETSMNQWLVRSLTIQWIRSQPCATVTVVPEINCWIGQDDGRTHSRCASILDLSVHIHVDTYRFPTRCLLYSAGRTIYLRS
jgi:hypothetical protein